MNTICLKLQVSFVWVLLSVSCILSESPQQGAKTESANPVVSHVGYPARIEQLFLPGSELISKPLGSRNEKVVVRLIDLFAHGDGFRYDLEFTGMEPGRYDLRDYLVREDGSAMDSLPAIPVEVNTLLPAGQVRPHELKLEAPDVSAWYAPVLVAGGGLWLLGLLGILFLGRGRLRRVTAGNRQVTVADRLRPLLECAATGTISSEDRADLERVLLAFWRKRLRLDAVAPQRAIAEMKKDQVAARLLTQLENWLHNPDFDAAIDWNVLLEPYRTMPAEELDSK